MSFQAYLDNIEKKTGKKPKDFKKLAKEKGLLKPGVKAMEVVNWLKKDFGLGHGHAMAIYAVFKNIKQAEKVKRDPVVIERTFNATVAKVREAIIEIMFC